MSRTAKGILIAAFCVLAAWAGLSTLYTYSVSEELTTLRREGRSDIVYLRCRIRDLESELKAQASDEPAADETTADETADDEPAETEPLPETGADTEEVTIPTHNSPETRPPLETEAPTETLPASPYLVAAHEGIIGIFDAAGGLLKTANVYIMTLPEADRDALTVGIPARDWAEALSILETYE